LQGPAAEESPRQPARREHQPEADQAGDEDAGHRPQHDVDGNQSRLRCTVVCATNSDRQVEKRGTERLRPRPEATAIRLHFELQSDASDQMLDTLLQATERYCAVYQTLRPGSRVSVGRS
jgi:hypothetical protein